MEGLHRNTKIMIQDHKIKIKCAKRPITAQRFEIFTATVSEVKFFKPIFKLVLTHYSSKLALNSYHTVNHRMSYHP